MSFALATLTHELRRYSAATLSLALSGILILAQIALMSGIAEVSTAMIDRSRADLLVLPPGARSFSDGGSLPARLVPLLFMDPGVIKIQPWEGGSAVLANDPTTMRQDAKVMVVDLEPGSLSLPTDFSDSVRAALREPFSMAVDVSVLRQMNAKIGDRAVLNRHVVKIAAALTTYPSVMKPTVFVSRDTFRLLGLSSPWGRVGPILVKLRDPSRAGAVAERLNAIGKGQFRVWTMADLARANRSQFMSQQVIGLMIGFSAILGLIIGIGITSQSMRAALAAEIPAFAAFRALGTPFEYLRRFVMELAFWIFAAACLLIAGAIGMLEVAAERYSIPFSPSVTSSLLVMALLFGVVCLSSLSALRVLRQVEPMDLLR